MQTWITEHAPAVVILSALILACACLAIYLRERIARWRMDRHWRRSSERLAAIGWHRESRGRN